MKPEPKLFVVTWVNNGQRRVRIFHHLVDADDWYERLLRVKGISHGRAIATGEVEVLEGLVHDVVVRRTSDEV